jgi:hypothetical protein
MAKYSVKMDLGYFAVGTYRFRQLNFAIYALDVL